MIFLRISSCFTYEIVKLVYAPTCFLIFQPCAAPHRRRGLPSPPRAFSRLPRWPAVPSPAFCALASSYRPPSTPRRAAWELRRPSHKATRVSRARFETRARASEAEGPPSPRGATARSQTRTSARRARYSRRILGKNHRRDPARGESVIPDFEALEIPRTPAPFERDATLQTNCVLD